MTANAKTKMQKRTGAIIRTMIAPENSRHYLTLNRHPDTTLAVQLPGLQSLAFRLIHQLSNVHP